MLMVMNKMCSKAVVNETMYTLSKMLEELQVIESKPKFFIAVVTQYFD